jgi:hypothetical protein
MVFPTPAATAVADAHHPLQGWDGRGATAIHGRGTAGIAVSLSRRDRNGRAKSLARGAV